MSLFLNSSHKTTQKEGLLLSAVFGVEFGRGAVCWNFDLWGTQYSILWGKWGKGNFETCGE
eukprot:3451318-Amphidinium_carterae.1